VDDVAEVELAVGEVAVGLEAGLPRRAVVKDMGGAAALDLDAAVAGEVAVAGQVAAVVEAGRRVGGAVHRVGDDGLVRVATHERDDHLVPPAGSWMKPWRALAAGVATRTGALSPGVPLVPAPAAWLWSVARKP
jgi:hypothetical protein